MIAVAAMGARKQVADVEGPRLRLVPPAGGPARSPREDSRSRALVALIVTIVLALAVGAALTTLATSLAMGRAIDSAAWHAHVVRDGETLWDIAGSSGVSADTQEIVRAIVDRNGAAGGRVQAGETIMVPSAY